ncbi:MAG: hypothetical protein ACRYGR_07965 [Janthinobacterium lividum]
MKKYYIEILSFGILMFSVFQTKAISTDINDNREAFSIQQPIHQLEDFSDDEQSILDLPVTKKSFFRQLVQKSKLVSPYSPLSEAKKSNIWFDIGRLHLAYAEHVQDIDEKNINYGEAEQAFEFSHYPYARIYLKKIEERLSLNE